MPSPEGVGFGGLENPSEARPPRRSR